MEAEKLAPQKAPLADALASKVDLYDLVPEIKHRKMFSHGKFVKLYQQSTMYVKKTNLKPNLIQMS